MSDKLTDYRRADAPLPEKNRLWPLYGTGLENLGDNGKPIDVPLPTYGPDELLVRHDACGLCFSDIKVIGQGAKHPRIYRDDLRAKPVVLGHEVTLEVIGVGENLRDKYHIGDRYIMQADIFVGGVGYAYGYELQGGLSQYNVLDQRHLNGDDGSYLIPIKPTTGYAESALVEPWACVTAAYRLEYRTAIKNGGTAWIIGTSADDARPYTISAGFDAASHPAKLLLSNVPAKFAGWLKSQAEKLGVEVTEVSDLDNPPVEQIDDIILLGADADIIEKVSPRLANRGIFALVADKAPARKVSVDIGRIHYNYWLFVGDPDPDIACAYSKTPVRATLKAGGKTWFVGAGGPMGRMHVQRAIELPNGPSTILCSDVSEMRLDDLRVSFTEDAKARGINIIFTNPMDKDAYAAALAPFAAEGFDDIITLAPIPPVIADAETHLAQNGSLDIFAGVSRGTMASFDLSDVIFKGNRYFGQSGSAVDDMKLMLGQAESGQLSTNRAVAAVGSLNAAYEGLRAVKDGTLAGKVVIFPNIKDLPLTPLPELKDKMPTVYAKLKDGREWTTDAEEEFLRIMLP